MGKILTNDLAAMLSERKHLSKKAASSFVNEMFNLIQSGLEQDKLVKIKGLGTFKIIDVDDRESVNVNTGERVLIEGHNKITFTPDALMKELVNKPFSQFETVVLNEGVDFSDMPSTEPEQQVVEEVAVDVTVDVADDVETDEDVLTAPLVEFVETPDVVAETDIPAVESEKKEEKPVESVMPVEEEPGDTVMPVEEEPEETVMPVEEEPDLPVDEEDEDSSKGWLKWALVVLACCLCFAAGYFLGIHHAPVESQPVEPEQKVADTTQVDVPQVDTIKVDTPKVDTAKVDTTKVDTTEVALDQYEKMDARVRTGAYYIVGLDHIEKVRAGDNLSRICKRTIGPDMECYLEVYNGIRSDSPLKEGQEIKIPKLELKKKKVKKQK